MLEKSVGIYENSEGESGCIVWDDGITTCVLITISDASKELNVSMRTIRRYLDEGKLIGIKVGGIWFVAYPSLDYVRNGLDEISF